MSDELGLVPLCLRSIIPEEMRCSIMGDHILFTDGEGNKWMTLTSYKAFTKSCSKLHEERSISLSSGTILWVVIMPQLPLQDAVDLKESILHTEMLVDSKGRRLSDDKSGGWCRGVPFLVRNMSLLESKVEEHLNFNGLSDKIRNLSAVLTNNFSAIRSNANYKDLISDSYLEEHKELCLELKEHLVLSLYWREICDDSDVLERFGPHNVILKLLPNLHYAIYGPGKHDPCNSSINNSDDEMLATEVSLKEHMKNLMLKNQSYQRTLSVDKQSLSLIDAKGKQEKLLKLADIVKRLDQSVQIFQAELDSICLDLEKVCVMPTLVGNGETIPDWVLVKDHDEEDFEEEGNCMPDSYPESSSDD